MHLSAVRKTAMNAVVRPAKVHHTDVIRLPCRSGPAAQRPCTMMRSGSLSDGAVICALHKCAESQN